MNNFVTINFYLSCRVRSRWTAIIAFWLYLYLPSVAQPTLPQPCQVMGQPADMLWHMGSLPQRMGQAARAGADQIDYIPLRPHIVRRSNHTGGLPLQNLINSLALLNRQFQRNHTGIQFYFSGTQPDYLDDDSVYNQRAPLSQAANSRDVADALNLYIHAVPGSGNYSGYAYYPDSTLIATRTMISTPELLISDLHLGQSLLAHELGHNFNLIHTFGPNTITDELVTRGAGANCNTAGDRVCDTPADPYNMPNFRYSYDGNDCTHYIGSLRDANGDLYTPDEGNIMSYYEPSPRLHCPYHFSAGQVERMRQGIALRRSFRYTSLTAPPTAVAAPSALVASQTLGGHLLLSWQDNASNEMGYLIERASDSPTDFEPIGGVEANVTSWVDNTVEAQRRYYYRLRPANATTQGLSATLQVTSGQPSCAPSYALGCETGTGLMQVVLGSDTLSRLSRCAVGGYEEFVRVSKPVKSGGRYGFQAQLLANNKVVGMSIWLDKNRNHQYEADELLVSREASMTGLITGELSLPTELASGPIGMRVIVAIGSVPQNACGYYFQGETEDYQLLLAPPDCVSVSDGLWTDSNRWSCGRIPTLTDTVRLKHQVRIPAYYTASAGQLVYEANSSMLVGEGAHLQLSQP